MIIITASVYPEYTREGGILEITEFRDKDKIFSRCVQAQFQLTATLDDLIGIMEQYTIIWNGEFVGYSIPIIQYKESMTWVGDIAKMIFLNL